MVGNAPAIDVVFLNMQIGTVMEQPVNYLRRLARGSGDNGGMERRVVIRNMAVEGDGRFGSLVWVHRTGCLGTAVEREARRLLT